VIVYLQSSGVGLKLSQLEAFKKEIKKFPLEIREDIFVLVDKYMSGDRLTTSQFKTFKIDKDTKIQEFKVKDHTGNWRAVSCIVQKDILVFVYAFHKKSQALLEKDKDTIRKRIRRIE
jgi:phage-related protein